MYKPAYFAIGTTTAFLSASSNIVEVDSGLYVALMAYLSVGDWTYLRVQNAVNTEIVKVLGLLSGNSLAISRGKEYSAKTTFLPGANVGYVDTVAGILDMLDIPALELNALDGIGIVGQEINYPILNIETLGGLEIADGKIEVKATVGCCGLLPSLPPPLPDFDLAVYVTGDDDDLVTSEDDYLVPR